MDTEERRAWGPLIREARKRQGLDQEDLAQMAGTTRRTIGSIERGASVAQIAVLQRILAALDLTPGLEVDTDVKAFVALITPLLQRLTAEERATLMPRLVELIADALRRAPTADSQPSAAVATTGRAATLNAWAEYLTEGMAEEEKVRQADRFPADIDARELDATLHLIDDAVRATRPARTRAEMQQLEDQAARDEGTKKRGRH